jgi:hypothetical protein
LPRRWLIARSGHQVPETPLLLVAARQQGAKDRLVLAHGDRRQIGAAADHDLAQHVLLPRVGRKIDGEVGSRPAHQGPDARYVVGYAVFAIFAVTLLSLTYRFFVERDGEGPSPPA